MDYCIECGRYFYRSTGRPVIRATAARGALTMPNDSICIDCRDPSDVEYQGSWYSRDDPMAEVARLEQANL